MPEDAEHLPPLGQASPAIGGRRPPWYRSGAAIASLGAAIGLMAGLAVGAAVAGRDGGGDAATSPAAAPSTSRSSTTLRPSPALPQACVESMRSAEQALQLFENGLQSIRQFQLTEIEPTVNEMQRLRRDFSGRVRDCLERAGG